MPKGTCSLMHFTCKALSGACSVLKTFVHLKPMAAQPHLWRPMEWEMAYLPTYLHLQLLLHALQTHGSATPLVAPLGL